MMAAPLALFMAIVLATAAAHKLVDRQRLAGAAANLLRLSLPVGQVISLAAASAEALAAIALVLESTRLLGALIAGALWLIYGIALLTARARGQGAFDCGCSFGVKFRPIDRFALARAFGLSLIAVGVALSPPEAIGAESVFAALALFSLYVAAGEIAALPFPFRSVAR